MVRGREPCSQCSGRWGQPRRSEPVLANARAVASRELGSAPLYLNGSGQPSGCGEARTCPEGSIKRRGRALRGERRRRVRKEVPGTWEARFGVSLATRGQPWVGSHNCLWGRMRESDRLIVVRKRGNARGAKEPWPESSRVRKRTERIGSRKRSYDRYNCQRGDRGWAKGPSGAAAHALWKRRLWREPDAGNLHVRFDEGEGCDGHWPPAFQSVLPPYSTGLQLPRSLLTAESRFKWGRSSFGLANSDGGAVLLAGRGRNFKGLANFPAELKSNFQMAGNCFHRPVKRIDP